MCHMRRRIHSLTFRNVCRAASWASLSSFLAAVAFA